MAADLLNDRVLPFYEENGVVLQRVLPIGARNIAAIQSITNMSSIFALHFFLGLGLLERGELAPLGEDEAFPAPSLLRGPSTDAHSGEVVPAPDGADAERRDGHAAPQELVGDPNLTPGGRSMASATTAF